MSNAATSARPPIALPQAPAMDREFIARNQIVERYFANKLPAKGALDFERFCRENPEILEELHVTERVHAGVRLLEAGGVSLPWEVRTKRFWEQLPFVVATALIAVGASATALNYYGKHSADQGVIANLKNRLAAQPLDPVQSTRSIKVELNREGPSRAPSYTVASARAELAELKLQLAWTTFPIYRLTVDRLDQGRVMILNGLQRDSNGEVRVALNTSLLGPGNYQLLLEGLNSRGDYTPLGWTTVSFVH